MLFELVPNMIRNWKPFLDWMMKIAAIREVLTA